MDFTEQHLILFAPKESLSWSEVWGLSDDELSPKAKSNLLLVDNDAWLTTLSLWASWTSQAIKEFQDLQYISFPTSGRFLKTNFLFLEALSSLREAVITALSAQFTASFAVLRTALQQFMNHYWWKQRLLGAEDYGEYYRWLLGKAKTNRFQTILNENYSDLNLPAESLDKDDLNDLYRQLCSYAHTPTLHESVSLASGSPRRRDIAEPLEAWLMMSNRIQQCLLDFMIASNPQAVFPVNLPRKFGFNPPLGALFDESNVVPLRQALGIDKFRSYRDHYEADEQVRTMLEWYNSFDDLSDTEILMTWTEKELNDEDKPTDQRINSRLARMKVGARMAQRALTYGSSDREIEDFMQIAKKDWAALRAELKRSLAEK